VKNIYVEIKDGFPINVDIQNAIDGIQYLNYNIKTFSKIKVLIGDLNNIAKNNPVIGSIDTMKILFKNINKIPEPIDYPNSVKHLFNREIITTNLHNFIVDFNPEYPKFIKPVYTKTFDGALISKISDLNYLKNIEDVEVFVSDPINILSEYRAFVYKKDLIYCCNYNGDFKLSPNYDYIYNLIKSYKDQPIAYTIDVAILDDGSTTCIEFNDFWAIGAYGLNPYDYANMLIDRYYQIIN